MQITPTLYRIPKKVVNYIDRLSLTLLCQSLGVSKSAAIIRLRQLSYIEDRPFAEYDDPLEVWL